MSEQQRKAIATLIEKRQASGGLSTWPEATAAKANNNARDYSQGVPAGTPMVETDFGDVIPAQGYDWEQEWLDQQQQKIAQEQAVHQQTREDIMKHWYGDEKKPKQRKLTDAEQMDFAQNLIQSPYSSVKQWGMQMQQQQSRREKRGNDLARQWAEQNPEEAENAVRDYQAEQTLNHYIRKWAENETPENLREVTQVLATPAGQRAWEMRRSTAADIEQARRDNDEAFRREQKEIHSGNAIGQLPGGESHYRRANTLLDYAQYANETTGALEQAIADSRGISSGKTSGGRFLHGLMPRSADNVDMFRETGILMHVADVAEKLSMGKRISDPEKALMSAYIIYCNAQSDLENLGGKTGMEFMGSAIGDNAPFLLEMAVTGGFGGAAAGAARSLMRKGIAAGVKNAARKGLKGVGGKILKNRAGRYVAKQSANLLGSMVGGAATAPFSNATWGEFARQDVDQYDISQGVDGEIEAEKTRPTSLAERGYKAGVTGMTDLGSEYWGGFAGAGRLFPKALRGTRVARITEPLRRLAYTPSVQRLDRYVGNIFKWDGLPMEFAEEELSNVLQPLLTGEPERIRENFSSEAQMETLLGVVAMGGVFQAMGTGAAAYDHVQSRRRSVGLLGHIQNPDLRQQVSRAMGHFTQQQQAKAISNIDWDNASLHDMAAATDYIMHRTQGRASQEIMNAMQEQNEAHAALQRFNKLKNQDTGRLEEVFDTQGRRYFLSGGALEKGDSGAGATAPTADGTLFVIDAETGEVSQKSVDELKRGQTTSYEEFEAGTLEAIRTVSAAQSEMETLQDIAEEAEATGDNPALRVADYMGIDLSTLTGKTVTLRDGSMAYVGNVSIPQNGTPDIDVVPLDPATGMTQTGANGEEIHRPLDITEVAAVEGIPVGPETADAQTTPSEGEGVASQMPELQGGPQVTLDDGEQTNIDSAQGGAIDGTPAGTQNAGMDNADTNEAAAVSSESVKQASTPAQAASEIAPVGKGPFGNIYLQFRGKPKEAIEFLLKQQEGEAVGALSHPQIGEIDLVWGKTGTAHSDGYGLAKIAKYHPEVLENLQGIISGMTIKKVSGNRIQLESTEHLASIRLDWDGNKKTWLLTAFEKETPTPLDRTTDVGENLDDLQNDTAPLQSGGVSKKSEYSRHTTTNQTAESDEASQTATHSGAIAASRMNAPTTNKDTNSAPSHQEIPRKKDGTPDYAAMEPGAMFQAIAEDFGEDVAREEVARQIEIYEAKIKKLAASRSEDINVRLKNRNQIQSLQAQAEALREAAGIADNSVVGQTQQTAVPTVKPTTLRDKSRALGDYLSVEDKILRDIAEGLKFRWSDNGAQRGLGTELGFSDSPAERKARFNILSNDGITVDQYAERLEHDMDSGLIPMALDSDMRSAILDVLTHVRSNREAYEAAVALRENDPRTSMTEDEARQQAAYEASRRGALTEAAAEQTAPTMVASEHMATSAMGDLVTEDMHRKSPGKITIREQSDPNKLDHYFQYYNLDGKPSGVYGIYNVEADINTNPVSFGLEEFWFGSDKLDELETLYNEYKSRRPKTRSWMDDEGGAQFRDINDALDFKKFIDSRREEQHKLGHNVPENGQVPDFPFRRSDTKDEAIGLDFSTEHRQAVEELVEELNRGAGADAVVFSTIDELPDDLQAAIRRDPEYGEFVIEGVSWGGHAYICAPAITDLDHVETVYHHEVAGHCALFHAIPERSDRVALFQAVVDGIGLEHMQSQGIPELNEEIDAYQKGEITKARLGEEYVAYSTERFFSPALYNNTTAPVFSVDLSGPVTDATVKQIIESANRQNDGQPKITIRNDIGRIQQDGRGTRMDVPSQVYRGRKGRRDQTDLQSAEHRSPGELQAETGESGIVSGRGVEASPAEHQGAVSGQDNAGADSNQPGTLSAGETVTGTTESEISSSTRFRRESTATAYEAEIQSIIDQAKANGTYLKAPNGKPTLLSERQWAQVRTRSFKRWFGDWEKAARLRLIDALNPISVDGNPSIEQREAEAVFSNLENGKNRYDGREVVWVKNSVGKIMRHKGFDTSRLIPAIKDVFDASVPILSDAEERKPGHKEHSNFKGYHHYVGKISLDGRDYYVRFTLQEINTRKKDIVPNQLHSAFVSDVEIMSAGNRVNTGNSPATAETSTPVDVKLQNFIESARTAIENSSKVVDENGEPLVVYHGTQTGGFTVFDNSKGNATSKIPVDGFMFASNPTIADGYSISQIIGKDETMDGAPIDPDNENISVVEVKKPLNSKYRYNGTVDREWIPHGYGPTPEEAVRKTKEVISRTYYRKPGSEVKNVFLSLKNPLIVEHGSWKNIYEYIKQGRNAKHDGVIIGNINDPSIPLRSAKGESNADFVAFAPNQIKSATDNTGEFSADNDDIRFRRTQKPQEESASLIAVHNTTEEQLKKSLELGGFPMPSIAITHAGMGHTEFGEISLLFDRNSIDPSNKQNKVYGGDAWTPTFPSVGYKLNEAKTRDIYRRANKVENLPLFNPVTFHPSNYERNVNGLDTGGLVDHFKDIYDAKQFYLAENGNAVTEYEQHEVEKYPAEKIPIYEDVLKRIGVERIVNDNIDSVRDEVRQILEQHGIGLPQMKPNVVLVRVNNTIKAALDYAENGNKKTEIDVDATKQKIDERIDQQRFEAWLHELFNGVVEKKGIRNNRDAFTPSGNSRKWEDLYDEVTLDNIVKAMQRQAARGGRGMFGGSIFGASQKEYPSIDEIRKEAKKFIQNISNDEFEAQKNAITDRLSDVKIPGIGSSFSDTMGMAENIKDAVAQSHTAKGIYRYLKEFYSGMTMEAAEEIADIVRDIQQMSSRYFESKPQRAVGFDEVRLAVVPVNTDAKLIWQLERRGIPVRTYERGNEEQRREIVANATEELDIRFRRAEAAALSPEEVNERFNEELKTLSPENAQSRILWLGNPSEVLIAAGVRNMPIKLYGNKLLAKIAKHGYSLDDVRNLPEAVTRPIAVFDGSRPGSHAVLTELETTDGENVLTVLSVGKGNDSDFNIVNSVYGKSDSSIAGWIEQGKLRWVDKEKALDRLRISALLAEAQNNQGQTSGKAALQSYQEHSSVTKILENFENPTWADKEKAADFLLVQGPNYLGNGENTGGNVEEGSNLADEKRSSLASATNIIKNFANPTRLDGEKVAAAEEMAAELGVPVRIVRDRSEIGNTESMARDKRGAEGWHERATGEIAVVLPNCRDAAEVQKTILHEAVGHYGIPELLGRERADEFYRRVFRSLDKTTQARLLAKHGSETVAGDEYLAEMAEGDVTPSVWKRIMAAVRGFFRDVLGINLKVTDAEMRYILWRSKHNPQRARTVGEAMDTISADIRMRVQTEREAARERKALQLEKLRTSEPLMFTGEEYKGLYELDNKSAATYINNELRGKYVNQDTGETIRVTRKGAFKTTRHDVGNKTHLQSVVYIPQMLENAILIDEVPNTKSSTGFDSYRYYVVGLKIDGVDYTAKLVVGEKNGQTYYDHSLTEIEKGDLINRRDEISSSFTDNKAANAVTGTPVSTVKDKRLLQILQPEPLKYQAESTQNEQQEPQTPMQYVDRVAEEMAAQDNEIRFRRNKRQPAADAPIRTTRENWATRIGRKLQDAHIPVRQLQDYVRAHGGKTGIETDVYSALNRALGRQMERIRRVDADFSELGKKMNRIKREYGYGYKQIEEYLAAKSSLERHASGTPAYSEQADAPWNKWHVEETVDRFEKTVPAKQRDAMWADIRALTQKQLEMMRQYGLISIQTLRDIQARGWKYYLPLQGMDFDFEQVTDPHDIFGEILNDRKGGRSSLMHRAKGRTTKPDDVLATLQRNIHLTIMSGEQNLAKQFLLRLAEANPELQGDTRQGEGIFEIEERWWVRRDENRITPEERERGEVYEESRQRPDDLEIEQSQMASAEMRKLESELQEVEKELWKLDPENDDNDLLATLLDQRRELSERIDQAFDRITAVRQLPRGAHAYRGLSQTEEQEHTVPVYRNGIRTVVRLSDPIVAQAINGDFKELFGGIMKNVVNVIGKGTRWMASTSTSWNPEFLLKNTVRDSLWATFYNAVDSEGSARGYLRNYPVAQKAIVRYHSGKAKPLTLNERAQYNIYTPEGASEAIEEFGLSRVRDSWFDDFLMEGGLTGYAYMQEVSDYSKKLARKVRWAASRGGRTVGTLREVMETVNDLSEVTTRFATFLSQIQKGADVRTAVNYARDITINFNRKGEWGRDLNSLFMFFNAATQGIANFYNLTRRNKARMGFAMAGVLGLSYTMSLLLAQFLAADDDDEQWFISDYQRYTNLCIPGWIIGSDDKVVLIPLPQELRPMWVAGTVAADVTGGRIDAKDAWGVFSNATGTVLEAAGEAYLPVEISMDRPMKTFVPSLFKPMYELYANADFTGFPIYREPFAKSLEGRIPESQLGMRNANKFISGVTEWLNEAGGGNQWTPAGFDPETGTINGLVNLMDQNPSKIEHLLTSYTGGLGRMGARIYRYVSSSDEERAVRDIPFINAFLTDVRKEINPNTEYYDIRDKYESLNYWFRKNQKEGTYPPFYHSDEEAQKAATEVTTVMQMIKQSDKTLDAWKKQLEMTEYGSEQYRTVVQEMNRVKKDFIHQYDQFIESTDHAAENR